MQYIYLNGQIIPSSAAKIDPNDRGFLLADGLFETFAIYFGKPFGLKEHWQRLVKSALLLEIPIPISLKELSNIIESLIHQNNLFKSKARLRLTLTRGMNSIRGHLSPTLLITVEALSSFKFTATAFISSIRRNEHSPIIQIKTINYLENILARREAKKNYADEAILLNLQGYVTEASTANLFMVKEDNIYTPPIKDGLLPGITRQFILAICQQNHLAIQEKSITVTELLVADELFLSNSIIEIQAITRINDRMINEGKIGKITSFILKKLQEKISLNYS